MKIAIPVSQSDQHLLNDFINVLIALGPVGDAEIIFFPTPVCAEATKQESFRLKDVSRNVKVVPCDRDWEGGWPIACNNHWHFVASYLDSQPNPSPWLWLEIDALPVIENWYPKLIEKYTIGQKSFMGFVKPTIKRVKDGPSYEDPTDLIMNGVAIYPPNITRNPSVIPLFNNMGRTGGLGIREPFDMYMRWQFKHMGIHNAYPFISHEWKSSNYVLEDGKITFDKDGKRGELHPDTILAHGCKDGSLHRIIAGRNKKPVKVITDEVIMPKGSVPDTIKGFGESKPVPTTVLVSGTPVEVAGLVEASSLPAESSEVINELIEAEQSQQPTVEQEDVDPETVATEWTEEKLAELKPLHRDMIAWLETDEKKNIQDFKKHFDLTLKDANNELQVIGYKNGRGGKINKL